MDAEDWADLAHEKQDEIDEMIDYIARLEDVIEGCAVCKAKGVIEYD